MTMLRTASLTAATLCAFAMPAAAQTEFEKVETKSEFVQAIQGKDLTMLGISVNVQPSGTIGGKAYGRNVNGEWRWKDGYFCRDLRWGDMDLGPNCQEVTVKGNVIRFQSDRGAGRYADLRMR